MRQCYVFDLDGTLANIEHRLHYIKGESKDWRGFFAACGGDTLITPVWRLYDHLAASEDRACGRYGLIIMSGRSDECHDQTVEWLDSHDIHPNALYMRKAGDHSPDHKCKAIMLDQMISDGWEPILFVDDRKQVVDMWRSLGYTVLQCAEGDF
jgi:hypothetical protein